MTDPTPEQIRELRAEAQASGDREMVTICEIAERGGKLALERVAEVLDDARAQDDEGGLDPRQQPSACEGCGGGVFVWLGVLGDAWWYRCRACGLHHATAREDRV